jgi:NADH:ubiquinone oxidoreductase subunit 5 (subunit L)/multisubunit Na+/H+ antiporter MnhA subunit
MKEQKRGFWLHIVIVIILFVLGRLLFGGIGPITRFIELTGNVAGSLGTDLLSNPDSVLTMIILFIIQAVIYFIIAAIIIFIIKRIFRKKD